MMKLFILAPDCSYLLKAHELRGAIHCMEGAVVSHLRPESDGYISLALQYKPYRITIDPAGNVWMWGHETHMREGHAQLWPAIETTEAELVEAES